MQSEKSILLTEEEFIVFTLLVGGEPLDGLKKYQNIGTMNEIELAKKWFEVKEALINKSYINQDFGEEIEISEGLFKVIQPYIQSKKRYSLNIVSREKGMFMYYYYVSPEGISSIKINNEHESEITLNYLKDDTEVIDHIREILEPYLGEKTTSKQSAIFSKADYYSFMAAMNMKKVDKAVEILESIGLEYEFALDAAKGFFEKNTFINLTYKDGSADDIPTKILMFYVGKLYCWYVRISDDTNCPLVLSSIASNQCLEGISQFIKLNSTPL